MNSPPPKRFQLSLSTLLLVVTAFVLGFLARNIADGLNPMYVGLTVPASTSPVKIGEALSIESLSDTTLNREVVVLSDGTINMPLIGIVDVNNQSPAQIQATLDKGFKKYMQNPMMQVYRSSSSRAP